MVIRGRSELPVSSPARSSPIRQEDAERVGGAMLSFRRIVSCVRETAMTGTNQVATGAVLLALALAPLLEAGAWASSR